MTPENRVRLLDAINAGRVAVETMIAVAELHPYALRAAWLTSRGLLDLGRLHNEAFPLSPPITGDDHLLRVVELRSELLRNHTRFDLEGVAE